jgi:hypothetical protein
MLPNSFSFYEAYGKHRNPDEIREIERQNRTMEARNEMYGDPVNKVERPELNSPENWEKKHFAQQRRTNNGFILFRPFTFFFSLFTSR